MPISLRSILIVSSHPRLGLPIGIFPVGVSVKILKALLPSSILATWPAHLNLLDLITLTILVERYKLWGCSLWSLLPLSIPFWALILASGPCFQIPFTYVPLLMHASRPYSTTGNIIVLFMLISKFLEKSGRQKRLNKTITTDYMNMKLNEWKVKWLKK